HGSVQIDGTDILYTPVADYHGEDSFVITLTDGNGFSVDKTVSVSVSSINDAPVATDDNDFAFSANDQGRYVLDVLANDTDIDQDVLHLLWVTTDVGQASIDGASIVLETASIGKVNLKYGIADPHGASAMGHAKVQITSDNALAPTIVAPSPVEVDATALFTKVDLGVAVAEDSQGRPLPVSLVDGDTFFAPGRHTVYWHTQDENGLEARASQEVIVHPLISISKDDTTIEGTTHTVKVFLNGEAPSYPLTIPYTVSGSSDGDDHSLTDGEVVINEGTEGSLSFTLQADDQIEGTETLQITLDKQLNLGSKSRYTLTVYEDNVAPEVSVSVAQQGELRPLIVNNEQLVTLTATVSDPDANDDHQYHWINDNPQLANISQQEAQFVFSPQGLTPGNYQLQLAVSDSQGASVTTDVYFEVVAELTVLGDEDSDGDLIPDNQEGLGDSDNDGILDYQDAIDECNVIQEQALESQRYLVEGEPGVCLRKGVTLANNATGGAQLLHHELTADAGATNIGGIFDFVAYGLPTVGQTYQVVFPQRLPIPAGAVYRKYRGQAGWSDFQQDANNLVSSTAGEGGYCPPPGDAAWRPGLTEGHWCVQLTIEDGGPNDDDGMANGRIVDPGGVATVSANTLPAAVNDEVYVTVAGSLQIDVLANDHDDDNDRLTLVSASAHFGQVSMENGMLTYQAADKFQGVDTIHYSVTDNNGGTAHAQVTVHVTPSAGGNVNNRAGGSMDGLLVLCLGLWGALRRYGGKLAAMVLALLSFNSQAHWYLQADAGFSQAHGQLSVAEAQRLQSDNQDRAWALGLGYQLSSDWAATARYLDLGEGHASLRPDPHMAPDEYHAQVAKVTPVLANGVALDMAYNLSQSERYALQTRVGAFRWRADFDSEYQGQHLRSSEHGLAPYLGVSADYRLNRQWQVGARVDHYFIEQNDVTMWSLQLSWHFD
ncbi:Ig-like domain-containing protein, partial [Shewanella sp. YIC-542]|uniref:Ig-like domain-containing protein n=1 Tax=Shewanella mytili TaxID=3377111 RepID=UPI00398EC5DA